MNMGRNIMKFKFIYLIHNTQSYANTEIAHHARGHHFGGLEHETRKKEMMIHIQREIVTMRPIFECKKGGHKGYFSNI